MRAIDADALHAEISKWPESVMYKDWVQSAIATAPTLTLPNEWVSVEERLPEKHSEYIVCACDEGESIDDRIWGDAVVVCADYYDGTFTWYEGNTEYDISDIVTHWMPLPAPPGKGNNVPTNEPLTLEQLREMDGEPVWFDTIKRWGIVKVCRDGVFVLTKSGEFEVGRCKYYRRPPEGEENT